MAKASDDLIRFVDSYEPSNEFRPCAYYGVEEDALMFYFRNDADYAKRLNSRVTIYLSMEGDELVGCQIKGVRRVLEELGQFDVTITHGKVKLEIVLFALMSRMVEHEETRGVYREVFRKAKEAEVELELPELIGA